MSVSVYLDRITLTLCLSNYQNHRFKGKESAFSSAFALMLNNRQSDAVEEIKALDYLTKIDTALAISNIWHEKRHFVDQILTSFGAYTLRGYFENIWNGPELLREASQKGQLAFPLNIYCDELRCELFNIKYDPESSISKFASHLTEKSGYHRGEKMDINFEGEKLRFSNENFFEF